MSKLKGIVIFTLGVLTGSLITRHVIKDKYRKLADEEITSVKEMLVKRLNSDIKEKAALARDKPGVMEYAAMINKKGYTNYNKPEEQSSEVLSTDRYLTTPYVISPEAFGEEEDYETISFTYYADSVLTDGNDEVVHDVDGVIGYEALESFGEYEDDSVFVRDDRLKCDYEILLDKRSYSDVKKTKPHQLED